MGFMEGMFFSVTTEQNYRFYTFILTLLRRLQCFLVNDDYIFATCICQLTFYMLGSCTIAYSCIVML